MGVLAAVLGADAVGLGRNYLAGQASIARLPADNITWRCELERAILALQSGNSIGTRDAWRLRAPDETAGERLQ